MKKLKLISLISVLLLSFIACGQEAVPGHPESSTFKISGTIILDNSENKYTSVNFTGSKCYIKVYDASDSLINVYDAASIPDLSNVGSYSFSNILIEENSNYKILIYIKAGSNYIVLDDPFGGGSPQIASIGTIKNTAGYNKINSGSPQAAFESFANGYPIYGVGGVKTTVNPSLEDPIQEP